METHSKPLKIIILSDEKPGHLNQSLAVAHLIEETRIIQIIPFSYKNSLHRFFLTLLAYLEIGFFLPKTLLDPPVKQGDDKNCVVISTGSSLAPITALYSKIHSAKSIVIMRPLWGHHYDLEIIPQHDHPKQKPNRVITLGSPTVISELNLEPYAQTLSQSLRSSSRKIISVFIGGNSKHHHFSSRFTDELIQNLEAICHIQNKAQNMDLLITTSRRTSTDAIQKMKTHFLNHPHCPLLIIPGETPQPKHLIQGMLGLATLVLVTEDSVSMISEAASSGKKVIVIKIDDSQTLTKHREMIQTLVQEGYVSTCVASTLEKSVIEKLGDSRPVKKLQDSIKIKEALQRLLPK